MSYRGISNLSPARGANWSQAGCALVLESLKKVFGSSSVFLPGGRAPLSYRGIWDESLLSFSGLHRISSSVHGFVLLPRPQPALRRGSPMGVRFWWILLLPRCAPSIFVEHPLTFPHSVSRCRSGGYTRSMPSLEPLAPRPIRLGCSGGRAPLSYRGPPQCKTDNGQLTTGQPFRLVELVGCRFFI